MKEEHAIVIEQAGAIRRFPEELLRSLLDAFGNKRCAPLNLP